MFEEPRREDCESMNHISFVGIEIKQTRAKVYRVYRLKKKKENRDIENEIT